MSAARFSVMAAAVVGWGASDGSATSFPPPLRPCLGASGMGVDGLRMVRWTTTKNTTTTTMTTTRLTDWPPGVATRAFLELSVLTGRLRIFYSFYLFFLEILFVYILFLKKEKKNIFGISLGSRCVHKIEIPSFTMKGRKKKLSL